MRIIERSKIARPAIEVWTFLIRPSLFRKWNNKIISMEAKEEFRLGQTFLTHYRMSGKEMRCASTVTHLDEPRFLELRHTNCIGNGVNPDLEVCERISLEERNDETLVTKSLVIKNHGLSWIVGLFVWMVTRFGKANQPDRLKMLCESQNQSIEG